MVKKTNFGITKAKKFIRLIETQGIKIHRAYLYGSYARGNPRSDSDIDIALISKNFSGDRWKDWDRFIRFRRNIDSRIEPVFYKPEDFQDEDPLVWEIKKSGIKISV